MDSRCCLGTSVSTAPVSTTNSPSQTRSGLSRVPDSHGYVDFAHVIDSYIGGFRVKFALLDLEHPTLPPLTSIPRSPSTNFSSAEWSASCSPSFTSAPSHLLQQRGYRQRHVELLPRLQHVAQVLLVQADAESGRGSCATASSEPSLP